MKIYAIEGNIDDLLLVDGTWVVNGAYECTPIEGTSLYPILTFPSHTDKKAYYVMEAPCVGHYNTVLGKAREMLESNRKVTENRVDVEEFREIQRIISELNRLDLKDISFYENGEKIEIDPRMIEDWKFVGLSNFIFITDGYYMEKFKDEVPQV